MLRAVLGSRRSDMKVHVIFQALGGDEQDVCDFRFDEEDSPMTPDGGSSFDSALPQRSSSTPVAALIRVVETGAI